MTEPSQISNEIEAITQRLFEQNIHKMTQIEQQLNSKFEEILEEIRTNKENNLVDVEEVAEDNRPCTSNSENRYLRKKHASSNETDKNRNQYNRFQYSEMHELRQPSTPFGVANVTLDDTIIINETRQEAEYHSMYCMFCPILGTVLNEASLWLFHVYLYLLSIHCWKVFVSSFCHEITAASKKDHFPRMFEQRNFCPWKDDT